MPLVKLSILVVAALCVSCADNAPPPPDANAAQKTVIDMQLKALDKAKAVQQTLDQQKKDMDKKLEDAGG